MGEVEHADYLQDFPILLLQLLPRKYAASRTLGTHEDTEHSASHMHEHTADDIMDTTLMKFIGN